MSDFDISKLVCYGCAHASSIDGYPGKPSGERPCTFCVRNKHHDITLLGCWYDRSKAIKLPMDCYYSLDMHNQMELWGHPVPKKTKRGENKEDEKINSRMEILDL